MEKRTAVFLICVIVFAIAFYFVATGTKEATGHKHPYDNILKTNKTPEWRASLITNLLGSAGVRADLQISPEKSANLDRLFATQSQRSQELWQSWSRSNAPKNSNIVRPFAAPGTRQLAIETCDAALALLTTEQLERLEELELRARGWDFVHVNWVSRKLELSAAQILQFKDLKIEETHLQTDLRRAKFNEVSAEEIESITSKLRAFDNRFLEVLDANQRQIRTELLGKPLVDTP